MGNVERYGRLTEQRMSDLVRCSESAASDVRLGHRTAWLRLCLRSYPIYCHSSSHGTTFCRRLFSSFESSNLPTDVLIVVKYILGPTYHVQRRATLLDHRFRGGTFPSQAKAPDSQTKSMTPSGPTVLLSQKSGGSPKDGGMVMIGAFTSGSSTHSPCSPGP